MEMQNIIYNRVWGKGWEQEFQLMSAPMVADPSDATSYSSVYKVNMIPSTEIICI